MLVKPVLGTPLPSLEADARQLAAFRRSTMVLTATAGLAGWPELTWTGGVARSDPRRAVGLLARPGNDDLLVDLLERLWALEEARGPEPGTGSAESPAIRPHQAPNP